MFQNIGFFFLPALFTPSFHPPQTQVQNDCTRPRPEALWPCWQWCHVGDMLWLLSRNEAQPSFTAPSVFTPKLLSSSCSPVSTQTVANPFVPTRSTLTSSLQQHHSPQALGELKTSWRVDYTRPSSTPCSLHLSQPSPKLFSHRSSTGWNHQLPLPHPKTRSRGSIPGRETVSKPTPPVT